MQERTEGALLRTLCKSHGNKGKSIKNKVPFMRAHHFACDMVPNRNTASVLSLSPSLSLSPDPPLSPSLLLSRSLARSLAIQMFKYLLLFHWFNFEYAVDKGLLHWYTFLRKKAYSKLNQCAGQNKTLCAACLKQS